MVTEKSLLTRIKRYTNFANKAKDRGDLTKYAHFTSILGYLLHDLSALCHWKLQDRERSIQLGQQARAKAAEADAIWAHQRQLKRPA